MRAAARPGLNLFHLESSESIPYFQGEMIGRSLTETLLDRLSQTPAVALLGSSKPLQTGRIPGYRRQDRPPLSGPPRGPESQEGYCVEQILSRLPKGATACHYRTHAGAEVDLVIEQPNGEKLIVEIKRTLSPKITPGLVESMNTIRSDRAVIVIPEGNPYPLSKNITTMGLPQFLADEMPR